jgi:hypothetical protein
MSESMCDGDKEQVHRINRALFAMLGSPEMVYKWWESPNKEFNGSTPHEIYESGEDGQNTVESYVMGYLQK